MSAGKAKNLDNAPTDPGAPQYLMSARLAHSGYRPARH